VEENNNRLYYEDRTVNYDRVVAHDTDEISTNMKVTVRNHTSAPETWERRSLAEVLGAQVYPGDPMN
jgi:hypothetical protein